MSPAMGLDSPSARAGYFKGDVLVCLEEVSPSRGCPTGESLTEFVGHQPSGDELKLFEGANACTVGCH